MCIFTSSSGLTITVGENAKENIEIRKNASQKDLWFHLHKDPSPHAILELNDKEPTRDDIFDACQLVKYFSKRKNDRSAKVIYIKVKQVGKVIEKDGAVELRSKPEIIDCYTDEESLERLLKTQKRKK